MCDLPQSATLQISAANGARQSRPCQVNGLEGKRLKITSQDRLAAGAVVTVECNDAMFMGEVLACTRQADASWKAELKVEQVLTGLQSLMTLRARLLGEPVPEFALSR